MDFTQTNILIAFGLTLFAGLATGLGSALAFFAKESNDRLLALGLSFSAGCMIFVSFVEIVPKARDQLAIAYSDSLAGWMTLIGFAVGIAMIALLDRLIPKEANPHEPHSAEEIWKSDRSQAIKKGLGRVGVLTALGIALHNFPEGLATFLAALDDPRLGLSIAIAIALHNIPEGISVAVPVYYATGSRRKACLYSGLSGLAEPLGALIGFFILAPFFSPALFGFLFAFVAGVMVFISLDELIPTAKLYEKGHDTVYGISLGMLIMGVSLELFR